MTSNPQCCYRIQYHSALTVTYTGYSVQNTVSTDADAAAQIPIASNFEAITYYISVAARSLWLCSMALAPPWLVYCSRAQSPVLHGRRHPRHADTCAHDVDVSRLPGYSVY